MREQNVETSQEITVLARGAGIVFVGTLFGLILKYIFQLIVARHLGAQLFGAFFLGVTIFSILERLSGLGLPNGIDHHLVFLAVNIFAVALAYGLILVVLKIPQEDRIVLDKIKMKLFTR